MRRDEGMENYWPNSGGGGLFYMDYSEYVFAETIKKNENHNKNRHEISFLF